MGSIVETPCPTCHGAGRERRTKRFKVRIPAGAKDGTRIRLKGKGEAGFGGAPAGDLFVTVRVEQSISQRLAEARTAQQDPAWREDYRATRPKVERKLGHLMHRKHGGRRARMRGQAKIDADFNLLAAAHNIARLAVLGIRSTSRGWATATA